MVNTKIRIFEQNVIACINDSQLPPVVVGLVLDRIRAQVMKAEDEMLQKEAKEESEGGDAGTDRIQ